MICADSLRKTWFQNSLKCNRMFVFNYPQERTVSMTIRFHRDDVKVKEKTPLYQGFLSVYRYSLQHRLFSSDWSTGNGACGYRYTL